MIGEREEKRLLAITKIAYFLNHTMGKARGVEIVLGSKRDTVPTRNCPDDILGRADLKVKTMSAFLGCTHIVDTHSFFVCAYVQIMRYSDTLLWYFRTSPPSGR